MFIGHFALGFGAKRAAPAVSLGTAFLACQLADLLWPTFVLLGIERFEIRPGIIRTDMISAVEKADEEKIAAGLLPQRRMGEGQDVALAVRAIASGYLDYCAGQILNVDGGFHMRGL